jgi:hypothetical protein
MIRNDPETDLGIKELASTLDPWLTSVLKFNVDGRAFSCQVASIKPAAPLLASVIRWVFFCLHGEEIGNGACG